METLSMEDKQKLSDKDWRLSHLYQITNKRKQRVPFVRNRAQRAYNAAKHPRNILLKSRQIGFTTDGCIDMLDVSLWTPNFNGLLIAQDLDTAKDIFSNKIELAWR